MNNDDKQAGNNHYVADDEIDLFELAELLWRNKLLIALVPLAFGCIALIYLYVAPVKPDYFEGRSLVQIGSYMSQQDEVQQLLRASDLVVVLEREAEVAASIPRGAISLIEISATAPDHESVESKLRDASAFISQREALVAERLSEQVVVELMQEVGKPSISLKSKKDKFFLVTVLALIAGLMVGIVTALLLNAINKRRELGRTTENQEVGR